MFSNNLFLFSLMPHTIILIATLFVWFRCYKNTAQTNKRDFLVQTSLAFGYLITATYALQISLLPINMHLDDTYNFFFFWYLAISSAGLGFLMFLWAKSLYTKLSPEKKARLRKECVIFFAINTAIQLYLWNRNLQFVGEWHSSYLQAQLTAFSTTTLYAVIRSKIWMYLGKEAQ